jgi:hypothetical protein
MDEPLPYIFHFAIRRSHHKQLYPRVEYDNELMVSVTSDDRVPVALQPFFAGAQTKKFDVEKGDDMKDRPSPRPTPQPDPAPKPRPN